VDCDEEIQKEGHNECFAAFAFPECVGVR
jgi:hypothetical protein